MTQLLSLLRAIHAGAQCADHGVGYSQMAEATGISQHLLMGKTSHLKARGLIERANPEVARCHNAYFKVTPAGLALLSREPDELVPGETTVQRAIRVMPPLATVWRAA